MRKAILTIALTLLAAEVAQAQQQGLRLPAPSPKATLTQTVGITDITINYSRPSVRGRSIWGALVPYDQVWRTGANAATTIQFSDDVLVEGQKLAKGTYSLHTVPGRDRWTVVFNTVADQWGSYSYDQTKDALRVNVTPQRGEFRETLTLDIPEVTNDTARVVIRWENVAVPFVVDTQSTTRALVAAEKAITNLANDRWMVPYRAADFAFNAGRMTEAQRWLDQAIAAQENTATLWLRARILQKEGKTSDALRYAEQAIAKATPQQADFAAEIRRQSAAWRK